MTMLEALTLARDADVLVRPVGWSERRPCEWVRYRDDGKPPFFIAVNIVSGNEFQMGVGREGDVFGEWEVRK